MQGPGQRWILSGIRSGFRALTATLLLAEVIGLSGLLFRGQVTTAQAQVRSSSAAAAPAPLQLSLQQALDLGLAGSLSLRSSALGVQEGQALVGLARSRFLPKLDMVGLGTWAQVGTSVGFVSNLPSIGDLNLNLGGDGYAVVQNTFLNAGLTLRLPLIDFGRTPQLRAARFELNAARSELSEQQRRSRFDIISAYLDRKSVV